MLTIAQISAFLLFLGAFGVDQPTINKVSDILQPTQASTTSIVVPTTLQATPDGGAVVSTSTPAFGSTPVPQSVIVTPMDRSGIDVRVEQLGGTYRFFVRILDADGNATKDAPVHFDAPDVNAQHPFRADQITNSLLVPGVDWQTWYVYTPTTKGTQNIVLTSGNLSKTISIEMK